MCSFLNALYFTERKSSFFVEEHSDDVIEKDLRRIIIFLFLYLLKIDQTFFSLSIIKSANEADDGQRTKDGQREGLHGPCDETYVDMMTRHS